MPVNRGWPPPPGHGRMVLRTPGCAYACRMYPDRMS